MTAREFNRIMRAMGRAGLESEASLTVVYERAFAAAARYYAEQFATQALVASSDWVPPAGAPPFDAERSLAAAAAQREEAARAIEEAFRRGVADFAISFDPDQFRLFSPDLLGSIGQHAASNFDASARDALGRVIRESFDAGLSVPNTAKAIRSTFTKVGRSTATMLARTDLIGLANGGGYMAARAVFQEEAVEKIWLNAHDGRVRPTHAQAGGQQVPMDAPFRVGGFDLMYPGDPQGPPQEVIQCRCTFTVADVPTRRARRERSEEASLLSTPPPPLQQAIQPMPSFTTTAEASSWAQTTGLVARSDFGALGVADVTEVLSGLATIRPYVTKPLDFLGVVPSRGRSMAHFRQTQVPTPGNPYAKTKVDQITFQRIVADQKKITGQATKARQNFDAHKAREVAERSRQVADETRPVQVREIAAKKLKRAEDTTRWTIWENTERPTFALVSHEAAHFLYYNKSLATAWKAALKTHNAKDWYRVSEYGSTSESELFSEAFAARATGQTIPAEIREALEEVLRSATE